MKTEITLSAEEVRDLPERPVVLLPAPGPGEEIVLGSISRPPVWHEDGSVTVAFEHCTVLL